MPIAASRRRQLRVAAFIDLDQQRRPRESYRSPCAAEVAALSNLKSEPIMSSIPLPFAIPADLALSHRRVLDYWEGLKRGENSMPFWDDLKLTSLPDLADRLMLVDAFDKPQRFRLNSVGERIRKRYGVDLADKYRRRDQPESAVRIPDRAGERDGRSHGPDVLCR
jgi:hypothetical protein